MKGSIIAGARAKTKSLPKAISHAGTGETLPVQALKSAAGYYLGTLHEGAPYSRESVEYWPARAEAEIAMETGRWTARRHLDPPPVEFTGGLAGEPVNQGKRRGR